MSDPNLSDGHTPEKVSLKDQREYAWSYFQLHANQRMSTFNFFVVIAALLTTGLAGTFHKDFQHHYVGVPLGLALLTVALIFWKLDQRVRYLIKHAEASLKEIEESLLNQSPREIGKHSILFSKEEQQTSDIRGQSSWRLLTYSECFGLVYLLFAILGLLGSLAAGIRWLA